LDAFTFVKGQSQLLQEEMVVLAMNSRNDVVATAMVHRGAGNEVRVNSADVFRVPVVHGATRMILVHNHPSGDPSPSPSDIALTRKFKGLGSEMGIQLLDHVVVGANDFASLRDLGLME
jgi:DNA repair protein RadC